LRDVPRRQEVNGLDATLGEVIVDVNGVLQRWIKVFNEEAVRNRLGFGICRIAAVQVAVLPIAVQIAELGAAVRALVQVRRARGEGSIGKCATRDRALGGSGFTTADGF